MKLQSCLILTVGLFVDAAEMASEHPVCRKKGTVVNIGDACCLEMGTWANQMAGIKQIISQEHLNPSGLEMGEERGRWCDLNRLDYEEYVQCECETSSKMSYIGNILTVKCGSDEEISVKSDYPCLPKACGDVNQAHLLLLDESLVALNCQITKIQDGNAAPPFSYESPYQEPEQKGKTIQVVGILASVMGLMGVLYWRLATTKSKKQPPVSLHEHFQDDLELTNGTEAKITQAEQHDFT